MKQLLLSSLAFVALSAPALSADSLVATGESIYDWSGFHVGIGGGRGAVIHDASTAQLGGVSLDGIGGDGIFGEISAGYDHVFSNGVVLGAIVSGRWGNVKSTANTGTALLVGGFVGDVEATYGFDAVARLGYSITPKTLAFVLGGYSWQRFELSSNLLNTNWNEGGYVLGIGMETAFRDNWTLRSEYRYANYSSENVAGLVTTDPSIHTFRTTLNYRLNGGNSGRTMAPVNYNWTGLKVGAAIGAGAAVTDISVPVIGATADGLGSEGVLGEINVGYDHEFGNGIVAGAVLAARYTSLESTGAIGAGTAKFEADYGFDALLRVGKVFNNSTLAYVIGGYSWQHFEISTSPSVFAYDWSASGYTIGTGGEHAISDRMTAYAEYRFTQYEDETTTIAGAATTIEPHTHTFRLGMKYKLY